MGFPDYRIQGVDIFTYWIRWKRNYLRNLINKLTIFFFVYFGFYYNSTIQRCVQGVFEIVQVTI